jgi:hypothetical protein
MERERVGGGGAGIAATFCVRRVSGQMGPWNAVHDLGGPPYLTPGCSSRETALRRLMGALQVDPEFKGHGLHVFPREGDDGYVVYLDS